MIDKNLPFRHVLLTREKNSAFIRKELPQGYTFSFYRKGDEEDWAKIETEVGQFRSVQEGIDCFNNEFFNNTALRPEDRTMFVKDEKGVIVATGSLWEGTYNGISRQRLHWIAVSEKCKGKGIAKALVSKLLLLNEELFDGGFLYLITGTQYYNAINIYLKFGFVPYYGKSPVPELTEESFCDNDYAWKLINDKLDAYKKFGIAKI